MNIAELVEDPSNGSDPLLEGVTFYVKYLGSCIVDKESGEETTSDAVKTIVTMVGHFFHKNLWSCFHIVHVEH